MRSRYRIAVISAALFALAATASAQPFPAKTVRIVNPFPVGGSADIAGRIIMPHLIERWGHQIYMESRAGGNTIIGTEYVAKSLPDGYTLLLTSTSLTVNAAVYPKLPFDTLNDLVAITPVTISPQTLVAHPSLPVKNIKELIALAKARPGQLNYADSGPSAKIAGQLFNMLAGVNIQNISYKGAAPMMIDVMGGHVTLGLAAVSSVQSAVRSGRVRLLGVGSLTPSATFPDAPVIANDVPGFEAVVWFGLLAPRGTPKEVVNRIHRDVAEVLRLPQVKQQMLEAGADPGGATPKNSKPACAAKSRNGRESSRPPASSPIDPQPLRPETRSATLRRKE